MTTPTPMKHAHSQQGRTPNTLGTAPTPRTVAAATPPVSTPFSQIHAAFSPPGGSRSSPQQFKKSPANSSTVLGHPGSHANYDSPSAAAAFGSLGDLSSLDTVGVATPAAISGLNASIIPSLPRTEEDDRLKRLVKVMEILEPFKGRVSEHGLDRLASRTGLDVMWEKSTTNGVATRTLMIAGKAVAIDIVCANNLVLDVMLSFPMAPPLVNKHTEQANKILLGNLRLAVGQSPLTKTLDDFAANLEHLAALDKLCVYPGLNCHEAIAGVYDSLEKLFKWDMERLLVENPRRSPYTAEMAALCTRHGRPVMHARSRVGLSIEYWKERWLVPQAKAAIDRKFARQTDAVFSLLIGCAKTNGKISSGGISYPSVRVSQDWISEPFEKPNPSPEEALMANGLILDWCEPEVTILPNPEEASMKHESPQDALIAGGKFPEVIFTATFDPPLTVPLHDYQNLCSTVEEEFQPPPNLETYDNLIFPIPAGSYHEPSQPRKLCETKKFSCFAKGTGDRMLVPQRHTLYINKRIYGYILKELPFSHPKQLVAMMPLLRQYAMLTTLLKSSFGDQFNENLALKRSSGNNSVIDEGGSRITSSMRRVGDDFDAFMTRGESSGHVTKIPTQVNPELATRTQHEVSIDMALFIHPVPSIKVNFPFRNDVGADVLVEVGPNGIIAIGGQNLVEPGSQKQAKMAKALQVLCNIGMWVNWIREEL